MIAVGDPQAPASKLFAILERNGVLDGDHRVREGSRLISIGDHFDYGHARKEAAESGLQILRWLASHDEEQVVILIGNHDAGRIMELARFDPVTFAAAQSRADRAYDRASGRSDPELEAALIADYPALPTAEIIARDYSSFTVEQRALVEELVLGRRMRLAHEEGEVLFTHAGVTVDNLESIGVRGHDSRDPRAVAAALNAHLDRAVDRAHASGELIDLAPLHAPGSSRTGEGRGILYHRPSHPDQSKRDLFDGPPARRFDPRRIPLGLTQVIGHIRDKKCRELLGEWASPEPPRDGPIRHLLTDGKEVRYRFGLPPRERSGLGVMIFIDGGMSTAPVEDYQLFTGA
jgi:hypothetical protein